MIQMLANVEIAITTSPSPSPWIFVPEIRRRVLSTTRYTPEKPTTAPWNIPASPSALPWP